MLHVDQLFLYLSRAGQHEERDFRRIGPALSLPADVHPSPRQQWMHSSELPRESHHVSSFERFPRRSSPWHSRPRSPGHPLSPVYARPAPSLLSMAPIQDPFTPGGRDKNAATFDDRRHPSDTFHFHDRSRQSFTGGLHSSTLVADVARHNNQPTRSAGSKYRRLKKHKPHQLSKLGSHGSGSGASETKQNSLLSKTVKHKRHGKSVQQTSSHEKTGDSLSAGQEVHVTKKIVPSVPDTAAENSQAAVADDLPASAESAIPIRPEDIIIIRRYNLESSTTEKKPEEGRQPAKRHVVRLVRNSIMSPTAAGVGSSATTGVNKSGTDAAQPSAVKRRTWGGVVKTTHRAGTGEGSMATSTVENEARQDRSKR